MEFLNYILPLFNEFNILFQSEKVLFPIISQESKRFLRQLCGNFVKPDLLSDDQLFSLNFCHPQCLVSLDELQLGLSKSMVETLKGINRIDVEQFKIKCLTFYQKAATESVKRFPVKETWLDKLDFLEPKILLNLTFNENINTNIQLVLEKFKHVADTNLAFLEVANIKNYFSRRKTTTSSKIDGVLLE